MYLEIPAPEPVLNDGYSDDEWPMIRIPAVYKVCPTCRGKGRHSNAIGVITQEDRDQNWTQEEFDDYMNGAYDQICEECKGDRVVLSIDYDLATDEEVSLYKEYQWEKQMEARERRMESGFYDGW